MTLDKVIAILDAHNIYFSKLHFNNVADFRLHMSPFAYLKNAGANPVSVLCIPSNNGHKNIELQFIDKENDGNYTFVDLYFGEYFYELFDCQEECLEQSIMDEITGIISNDVIVIVANDLKNKRWYSSQIFDKKEKDGFGLPGFERAMQQISKRRKKFFPNPFKSKMQYDIYDWNTYQCIVK